MRIVSITVLAALVAVATASALFETADIATRFAKFKTQYNRQYANAEEEARRLAIFEANMKTAAELQIKNPLARFGENDYADMSPEEFKSRHSGEGAFRAAVRQRASRIVKEDPKLAAKATGSYVDWRNNGAVTPIKNQAQCGGCWAFSTTGNIEGQWAIAGNGLVSLSEQELISCDTTCNACNGGLMDDAFEWIINANGGGITSEAQYPYQSGSGSVPPCQSSSVSNVATIASYIDVSHSEAAMKSWVASNGPLSIAVDATAWQTYAGGIMTDCTSNQIDHGVLIVGYNTQSSPPYWIIKNQWGTSWGEAGYMWLEYGANECLITTLPSSSQV